MVPKEHFNLYSNIKNFIVLVVAIARRWCAYIVRRQPLLRKSIHVYLCTQTFLGRPCSITLAHLNFIWTYL